MSLQMGQQNGRAGRLLERFAGNAALIDADVPLPEMDVEPDIDIL